MSRAQEPPNWREDHKHQRDNGIRKRSFRVVGTTKVAGKSQGETVELEMPTGAIDALIQAGCIQELGSTVPDITRVVDEFTARPENVADTAAETRAIKRARNQRKGNNDG